MYGLSKFERKKDVLKHYMPFAKLIDGSEQQGIVINKDGSLQTTFGYRGPDLKSSLLEELGVLTAQLNSMFMILGTGWVFYFEAQRNSSTEYATDSYFLDPVTKAIDDERKQWFTAGMHYENNYYLTIYWKPSNDVEGRMKDFMIEGKKRRLFSAEDHLKIFRDRTYKIFKLFGSLRMPEIFWLNKGELATYLHSTVSAKRHHIKVPLNPILLDSLLYDTPLNADVEPMLGDQHLRIVVPLTYPPLSEFGMFDELNQMDFAYRWVTRFYCMDKQDALSELSSRNRAWKGKLESFMQMIRRIFLPDHPGDISINENAQAKVNEVERAKSLVEADELGYGFYSTMLVILDKDRKRADDNAKAVEEIFSNLGMKTKTEDLNAIDAWQGSIPGAVYNHCRRPMISTANLVHLIPIADVWAGPKRNQKLKGPALMYTQTGENTPFRLDLHVGDVGHTLIVGPTGAGKSVHLNMIAAQFRKYKKSKVFIFDKGGSSRILTAAVGGNFFDIANEDSDVLTFQPLSQIDDELERAWAAEWLYDFLRQEKVDITPEVKKHIRVALQAMSCMESKYRTTTGLVSAIQDISLKSALTPLTLQGEYGRIFDAERDRLQFSFWQTFEMETLINMRAATLISSTLFYLFHRIEQQLNGDPTLIIIDEGWLFLNNPVFAAKIVEWLKTLRKNNASVVFATQSLADTEDEHKDSDKKSVFSTILDCCFSRIFLPNPRILEKNAKQKYYGFGLNDREIHIIASAIPKRHYYYTSSTGCRLYELKLGKEAKAYCAVDKVDQIECKRILREYGQEGFVDQWRRYKGLEREDEDSNDEY